MLRAVESLTTNDHRTKDCMPLTHSIATRLGKKFLGHRGMEDGRCTNSTKKKSAFSIDQIPFSGFNMFQYVSINILY